MMLGMSDYERDAQVIETPEFSPTYTHAVSVDLLEDSGDVIHQIVSMCFGYYSARTTAEQLNRWRDQTKFKQ
jgi:hypothetical protein